MQEFLRVTHLKKIGFKKGYIPWNKGIHTGISPMLGKKHNPETIIKLVKNNTHYWKGKSFSEEHKKHLSENHADIKGNKSPMYGKSGMVEEKHPQWKGDKVGYYALHDWVKKKLGMPQKCEWCGISDLDIVYHWANKSGEYKRDVTDWLRLFPKCHRKHDLENGFGTIQRVFDGRIRI
jgi:hypothetical protein